MPRCILTGSCEETTKAGKSVITDTSTKAVTPATAGTYMTPGVPARARTKII